MKKFLIICLVMFATILPSFATNWFEISDKFYIDTDSIEQYVDGSGRVVPNQYVYWVKYLNTNDRDWKYEEQRYGEKLWYMQFKKVVDINRKIQTLKFVAVYNLNSACIDRRELSKHWEPCIPDTIGGYEYEKVKEYAQ